MYFGCKLKDTRNDKNFFTETGKRNLEKYKTFQDMSPDPQNYCT